MADEPLTTETTQPSETPAAASPPAAAGGTPTLAELAAKGDVKAFNAAREASLRGERGPVKADAPAEPAKEPEPAAEPPAAEAKTDDEAKPPVDPKASAAGKELAKKKGSLQERINELTHDRYATARERDAAVAEVNRLRQEMATLQRTPAKPVEVDPAALPKPKVADFETYEEWTEAVADWKADQKAAVRVAALEKKFEERLANEARARGEAAQQRQQQTLMEQHTERSKKFLESHADAADVFAELDTPEYAVPPMMQAHIVQSDQGPALLYHLAKNPDEFRRLVALPPGPMLVQLGKLEARLDVAPSGPTPAAKPVTSAPPPIKPVGSSATATTLSTRDLAQQGRGREFMERRDREERERKFRRA